jgi:hypothetical protein
VQLNQATRQINDINVVTLVPFAQKRGGKIGLYYLGSWPFERGGKPPKASYANPTGFIEVTPQNADTQVSEHFRLRDFLTKDQPNQWPKYLLLNPRLIDKLELVVQELRRQRIDGRFESRRPRRRARRRGHSAGGRAGGARASLARRGSWRLFRMLRPWPVHAHRRARVPRALARHR